MSLQVEQLEHNMAKLTIEVSAEELEGALQKAYQNRKAELMFLDSVKEKFRASSSKRCTDRKSSMMMQQTL